VVPTFRILGPVECDGAGRVPGGRPRALLVLLLLHRGAPVAVDRLVDELWEGAGPRHGRRALHVVASRLRAALGDGVLRSEGAGYAVRVAPGELDAERFETLHRRGLAELEAGHPREAAATLRLALALWRGRALAEVRDQRWAQP
jgi:DNA-binding SARP family transcriptional activator